MILFVAPTLVLDNAALDNAALVVAPGDAGLPVRGALHGYGTVEPDAACPCLDLRSVITTTGQATDMGKSEPVLAPKRVTFRFTCDDGAETNALACCTVAGDGTRWQWAATGMAIDNG
jgi:hypothetical protein